MVPEFVEMSTFLNKSTKDVKVAKNACRLALRIELYTSFALIKS